MPELTDDPTEHNEMISIVGEGLHATFRKGCENGSKVHQAIRDMPDGDYREAVEWFVYCLEVSGYKIIKSENA